VRFGFYVFGCLASAALIFSSFSAGESASNGARWLGQQKYAL